MAGKRVIPGIPKSSMGTDRVPFDQAIKENMEVIMGQRGARLDPLPLTATNDQIIRRMNEIIERLQ